MANTAAPLEYIKELRTLLYPCPICNSAERLRASDFDVRTMEMQIYCQECGHGGPKARTTADAVILWNGGVGPKGAGVQMWHTIIEGYHFEVRFCPHCTRGDRLEVFNGGDSHQVRCHHCNARGPSGSTRTGAVSGWNGFRAGVKPRPEGLGRRIVIKRPGPRPHTLEDGVKGVSVDLATRLKSISDSGDTGVALDVMYEGKTIMRIMAELVLVGKREDREAFMYRVTIGSFAPLPVHVVAEREGMYTTHLVLDEDGPVKRIHGQYISILPGTQNRTYYEVPPDQLTFFE